MKNFRSLCALMPLVAFGSIALAIQDPKPAPPAKEPPAKEQKDEKPKPATIGAAAPEFALKDLDGKTVKLSDYKGKVVVLEWFNPGCPVIQGCHKEGGALRGMATRVAPDGVVWLAINSSAAGKEGSGAEANKKVADEWKLKHPILLDESGEVGRMYGAQTTPHMFVIDAKGVLVYRGAIDNAPGGKVEGGGEKVNYVSAALADLKAGKPVATQETKSYGCSVKYARAGT